MTSRQQGQKSDTVRREAPIISHTDTSKHLDTLVKRVTANVGVILALELPIITCFLRARRNVCDKFGQLLKARDLSEMKVTRPDTELTTS